MKTVVIVIVDSILVLVLAGYAAHLHTKFNAEQERLKADNAALTAQLASAQAQLQQLSQLEAQTEALTAQVKEAAAAEVARPAEVPAAATTADPAAGPADTAAPAPQGDEPPMKAMMKMFQGEGGKKMREATARASVDMQYGTLLKDLALPADVDAQVRDMLTAHMGAELERSMSGLEQGTMPSGKDMVASADTAKAELRAQLAQVLNADELAQWDEYEAELPRHMLEQSLDMQFNMFATNMDDETRQVVRDTLVDELLTTQEEMLATESPVEIGSQLDRQAAAYTNARELLANTLTEEQFMEADRFLTHQEQMMAASMEMFRGMTEEDLPGSPSEPVEPPNQP